MALIKRKRVLLALFLMSALSSFSFMGFFFVYHQSGAFEAGKEGQKGSEPVPVSFLRMPTDKVEEPNVFYKVVHLDLKGAPPKMDYLIQFFGIIKKAGANAILVEYEDMFPYQGRLGNLSARNAYTPSLLKELLRQARVHALEIIPLVQTFGHMEFALKLTEFQSLREVESFPQEICPSHPQTSVLIHAMLDQVMRMHGDAKFLHIGCDEVFHLASCERCALRLRKEQQKQATLASGNDLLFLEHVKQVAVYARKKYGVKVLIWDDQLRNMGRGVLQQSELSQLVEPVIWDYSDEAIKIPQYVWHTYATVFDSLWVAGSYKGAYGATLFMPNLKRHAHNQLSWKKTLERQKFIVNNLRGVILTGWSRYDHFAALCELLPPALPSLVISLAIIEQGTPQSRLNSEVFDKTAKILGCPGKFQIEILERDPFMWMSSDCRFPGHELVLALRSLYHFKLEVPKYLKEVEKSGWMTKYHQKLGISSPWRVLEGTRRLQSLISGLTRYKFHVEQALERYYDRFTVTEWIEQQVTPLLQAVESLEIVVWNLNNQTTWPRRPWLP